MDVEYSFEPWYKGKEHGQGGIADDAFEAVKRYFDREGVLNENDKSIMASATSIEHVQRVVAQSLSEYQTKTRSSKTRKWLQRASETICHYGTVLDVFVQHHPEYVSLVWGTMKLLFVSVINHAETLKRIAKSISQIGSRLPRIQILSELYPTQYMRVAIEKLYSCILEFLLMAYSWCNESKFRHFYHSFTRPHELCYGDVLERITLCSNDVIEIATVGSQAELRTIHVTQATKLDDVISTLQAADMDRKDQFARLTSSVSRLEIMCTNQGKQLNMIISLLSASGLTINGLLEKIETSHAIQTSAQLNTNQRLSEIQLSQVLSTFDLSFENPDNCYKHHRLFRDRRVAGMGPRVSTNKFWLSPKLNKWSSKQNSSLVIIKGSFSSRPAMMDFSIDVIQTLISNTVPVIWALPGAEKSRSISTTTELIKYLSWQALKLGNGANMEKQMSIRYSQFQTSRTLDEWFELFNQVVATAGRQVYIILDLSMVCSSLEGPDALKFLQELRMMLDAHNDENTTKVKLLLVAYEPEWFKHLTGELSEFTIPVKKMKIKGLTGQDRLRALNIRFNPRRGVRYRGQVGRR